MLAKNCLELNFKTLTSMQLDLFTMNKERRENSWLITKISNSKFSDSSKYNNRSQKIQQTCTCSKSTIETPEKVATYIQS